MTKGGMGLHNQSLLIEGDVANSTEVELATLISR